METEIKPKEESRKFYLGIGAIILIVAAIVFYVTMIKPNNIIIQINKDVSDYTKSAKCNFKYVGTFESNGFTYKQYENEEYSEGNQKAYKNNCYLVFNSNQLVGVKLKSEMSLSKSYISAKTNLCNISSFNLTQDIKSEYKSKINKDSSIIGDYEIKVSKIGSSETFTFALKDYAIMISID